MDTLERTLTRTSFSARIQELLREPLVREITVCITAGGVAGIVVGGLGARLVMRFSAIAAGAAARGILTENGNRVGSITGDGTMALILFGGLFMGLLGGLALLSVRALLPHRLLVLTFATVLLGLGTPEVLDAGNADFVILDNQPLNVAMFLSLFVLFAVLAVWLADRLPSWLSHPPLSFLAPLFLAGSLAFGGLILAFTVGASLFGREDLARGGGVRFGTVLLATVLAIATLTTSGATRRIMQRVGAVVLIVGTVGGLWIAVDEVRTIL